MALADAGFSVTRTDASRTGIVLGSGFCGLSSSEEFHKTQVLKGFLDLNPMLFPNAVKETFAEMATLTLAFSIEGFVVISL